jgi:hypothetical protein
VLAPLQRITRQSWFGNEVLVERASAALCVLHGAEVEVLALKGLPLALEHYAHPSLRPMTDVDVLVQRSAARRALDALREAGWSPSSRVPGDVLARLPEVTCRSPDGLGLLDLHWRLVPWVDRDGHGDDPALWAAARRLEVRGAAALVPAPHDLLLHVLLHAYRSGWAEVPRFAADTIILTRRAADELDWDAFLRKTTGAHLTLPVGEALRFVVRTFDAPVPDATLDALSAVPPTRRERRKHRVASKSMSSDRGRVAGDAQRLRIAWARTSVNLTRVGAARTCPPFLRQRFNVDRLWAVPFVVAGRRVTRSIRRRATVARP